MGLFDDLIPQEPKEKGIFEDLIPDTPPATAPGVSARPVARPTRGFGSVLDETDDDRAARGFGRSAYQSGLIDAPDIPEPNNPIGPGSTEEQLSAPKERPSISASDLAKRAARGFTEVGAAVPEALAIAGVGNPNAAPLFAQEEVQRAKEQIALAESRLSESANKEDRERITAVIEAEQRKVAAYEPLIATADGPLKPDAKDRALFKAGDKIRQASLDLFGAPEPSLDDRFLSKLAEGAGNMAGFVGVTVLTGVLGGAAAGSALNTSSMYNRAIQEGATEDQAKTAAYIGSVIGASEVVPIARAFDILPSAARERVSKALGKRMTNIFATAGEEGIQEAMAEIANNLTAKGVYKPEQEVFEGVTEAALIGAILGGGIGAVAPTQSADTERLSSPRLSSSDRASPIPNDIIDDGKAILDGTLPPTQPDAPRSAPERPSQPEVPVVGPDTQADAPAPLTAPEVEQEGASPLPPMGEAPDVPQIAPDAPQEPEAPSLPKEAEAPQSIEAQTYAPDQPEAQDFEDMPEVDGDGNETGRTVRIDLNTGRAQVVEPDALPSVDKTSAPEAEPAAQEEGGLFDDLIPAPAPKPQKVAGQTVEVLANEDLTSIEADAATFQYKSGGDSEGVTDRLTGVKQWDTARAGSAIVFEYADGRRVVADGHQRLGLAKRMRAEGQDVAMPVIIRRETDGYTPESVMVEAALKNISESPIKGTPDPQMVVDAAKVLRAQPNISAEDLNLPPNSALARDAMIIRNLSDDAFGMLVNERASVRSAAAVAKMVPDKAAHVDIVGLLEKLPIKNVFEAEQVARQAAADTTTSTQTSLFGDEEVTNSNYLERARVMDVAIKRLRKDKATFNTLLERGGTIAEAGNVLDQDANKARMQQDAKVQEYLTRQANVKGPISDALSEAAAAVKSGKPIGQVVTGFVENVRSAIEGVSPTSQRGDGNRGSDEQAGAGKAEPKGEVSPATQKAIEKPSSWVLRNKTTGKVELETSDPKKVEALNTEKYEAVPIAQHLAELNDPETLAYKAVRGLPVESTDTEQTPEGEQALIPGTREDQGRDEGRDRTEIEARAKQSKMGPTAEQGNAGPLFGDDGGEQGGLFEAQSGAPDQAAKETEGGNVRMYQRAFDGSGDATLDAGAIEAVLPDLRKRLNKLALKQVDLEAAPEMDEQGAVEFGPNGRIAVLIGQTLDAFATINHEAIHILRAMNLFTGKEWDALSSEAERFWIAKHDIEGRYPDLSREAQIEEAIAEEFASYAGRAPNNRIKAAFAKMKRFFRALRDTLTGQNITRVEDIFADIDSGSVGARDGAEMVEPGRKDQRPSSATRTLSAKGRADLAASTHSTTIPDRSAWDELAANNVSVLDRASGAKAGLFDSIDKMRVKLQDRMLPLLRAEQAVERLTGTKVDKKNSPYYAEERYTTRVGYRLDQIEERFTRPIVALISSAPSPIRITDASGNERKGYEAVSLWLMARHAKERNAHIASINPKMPDGGSGLTNAEADAILAQAGANASHLNKIGNMTDALGQEMIDVREAAGLLSAKDAMIWRRMYKHYMPLRNFAETDMYDDIVNEGGTNMGRKYNARGAESKQALGRNSEAFDPLATILTQAQEVAIRAEKNLVAKTVWDFVATNPNPAMWEISTPETQRFFNSATGQVEERVVGAAARPLAENEMAFKHDGKERRITLNDPRLAAALGQIGTNELSWASRQASKFSRYFSTVNTMLSPPFVIVNGFRDMITAQVNLGESGREIRGKLRKKALTTWIKAARGAYRGMGGKSDTEFSKYYQEYAEAGGKISFWNIEDPQSGNSDLKRRVKRASRGKVLGTASRLVLPNVQENPALAWIERVNLTVDNAVRLATYVEARKNGWSKEDAASLSKNLTVNFNRRGEAGSTLNAWYPFANAAIQGSHVILKSMKSKEVQAIVGGMFLFGMANDLLNAALSERDEDGELEYDQLPNYVSERNLILATPGGENTFATVPLPYGYNFFFYAGQQMGKMLRGVKDPGEASGHMFKAAIGGFSPLSGETAHEFIMPTVLDFANEFDNNKDWLGRPIRPENPYGDYGPQAYKSFNASGPSSALASALNSASGGSRLESGLIDVSPEYIDHFFKFLGGGAGRFAGRIGGLAERAMDGTLDQTEAYEIPLLRVLRTESGDFLNQNRYFEFRDAVNEARAQKRLSDETGVPMTLEMENLTDLWSSLRSAEKKRKKLSGKLNELYADETLSRRELALKVKAIRNARNGVYLSFNRAFIDTMGPQAE